MFNMATQARESPQDETPTRFELAQDLAFADAEQSVENRRHVSALLGSGDSGATLPSEWGRAGTDEAFGVNRR